MNDTYTQTDLSDAIHDFGHIVTELDNMARISIEIGPTNDKLATVLSGLHQIYTWKFDILFKIFEELVGYGIIDDSNKNNNLFVGDRFDLENSLMVIGTILDEVEGIIEVILEGDPTNIEISNALNGFHQLTIWKVEKVVRIFNGLIENGVIKN